MPFPAAALLTGETIYLVTLTNRHGSGTYAFSSKDRAEAFAFKSAVETWGERNPDGAPDTPTNDADFWTAYYEACPDDNIEDDEATIDSEA